ncbi:phospholipase D Z-like [Phalaenopsis equestris]|uniref:Phospholipase D Z-like protein n=1 Tax=Phalaenopsis equestris TaxID=78828 RepID=A0A1S6YG32_PHAEQ|nr:phospholipase D Z-like [Phalaenopsis equestris]AQX44233.1 phospholipase D Z-like protein [Phalaenopsis equestris]
MVRSCYPLLFVVLLLAGKFAQATNAGSSPESCNAWLVQSIPTDMPLLTRVPGVLSSGDVFRWMAGNATRRLDVIAQYWQLLAQSGNPKSGDYGYSNGDLERFGAGEGRAVYRALEEAAERRVDIRFLQHSGVYPDYTEEPSNLAAGKPNVQNVTLLLSDWWGSGIVHAKVWISDSKDIYIGSANNDWKSLTQVKEVGVYIVGCPSIAKRLEHYFENLWTLSSLNATAYTRTVWDNIWQASRKVPCWSHFIPYRERCSSPLPHYVDTPLVDGYPFLSDPDKFNISLVTPGYCTTTTLQYSSNQTSYLSFAPPELLFNKLQADEQAWVETIKSATFGGTVRINTMDWLGQSQYTKQTIYWSSLSSAVSEVIFSKNARVNLLVAYWTHNLEGTEQYLKSLLYSNILCRSSKYNKCRGKIAVKYYKVPFYDKTGPALINGTATGNIYPAYSRVNHGKYVVSDVRAHVGTSNLVWDYFYTTAGVSFGTYNPGIVSQLQEIFDADWNSPYAVPVEPIAAA